MRLHTLTVTTTLMITLGLAGCEVNGGFEQPGPADPTPGETPDPTDPADPVVDDDLSEPAYYAVFIEDRWAGRCATSSVGAHGADIDAVALWDPSDNPIEPELVATMDLVDVAFDPTVCDRYGYYESDLALGEPDASLTDGFYSLAGGWLIGEFESQVEILPHYLISVYEVDDSHCMGIAGCVGSEGYDVYLATDLDCVNQGPDFRETCMVKLTGSDGAEGSASLRAGGDL